LVAAKFRILLLFGDQLGDFLTIPPGEANLAGREKLFVAHQSLWGERWFQLPNPMYGSWEGAVGFTVADKLKHLRQ
jgi:acid phosphatase